MTNKFSPPPRGEHHPPNIDHMVSPFTDGVFALKCISDSLCHSSDIVKPLLNTRPMPRSMSKAIRNNVEKINIKMVVKRKEQTENKTSVLTSLGLFFAGATPTKSERDSNINCVCTKISPSPQAQI